MPLGNSSGIGVLMGASTVSNIGGMTISLGVSKISSIGVNFVAMSGINIGVITDPIGGGSVTSIISGIGPSVIGGGMAIA